MLCVGVLEKVDGEGMQNLMIGPGDFVMLLVTITFENVVKKSQHESNLVGKCVISKKSMEISLNKLENQKIGLNTTRCR